MERMEQEQAEQELLFRCLKPVKTGYHHRFCCMDGTCQSLLNQITDCAVNKLEQDNVLQGNMYWCYSSPRISKMSLAHLICVSLDKQNHLAGAFSAGGTTQF